MPLTRERKRGIAAKFTLLVTAAIWGSAFIVLKDAIDGLPTFFVLAFRFLTGGALLAAVFFRSFKNIGLKVVLKGAATGAVVAAAYAVQTIGLKHTTPGVNAFLTAVYCVITPFMTWAVTRKRPSVFRFAAASICFAGIGLLSVSGGGGFTFMGEGMTLISGVFFAAQIVLIDVLAKDEDPMQFTVWELLSCGAILLVVYLAAELDRPLKADGATWGRLIYLGAVATALALALMTMGVRYASPVAGALIMSLESVFGVVFSLMFGYEKISAKSAFGFLLIFVAIVLGEGGPALLSYLKNKTPAKQKSAETAPEVADAEAVKKDNADP